MQWLVGALAAQERNCCGSGLLHSRIWTLGVPVPQRLLLGFYACVQSDLSPVSVYFIYATTGVPVIVLCPNSRRYYFNQGQK